MAGRRVLYIGRWVRRGAVETGGPRIKRGSEVVFKLQAPERAGKRVFDGSLSGSEGEGEGEGAGWGATSSTSTCTGGQGGGAG